MVCLLGLAAVGISCAGVSLDRVAVRFGPQRSAQLSALAVVHEVIV